MRTPPRISSPKGFTLIEILFALALFGVAIGAVMATQTRSKRDIKESELLTQAQALGEMKMTEMELKYQEAIDKAGIKSAFGHEEGGFDDPYGSTFKWTAELKENPNIITSETLLQFLKAYGMSEEDSQQQFEQSKLLLTNLNKALKENMAELVVKITWEFPKGKPTTIPLVTHLVPKKPKVTFTQNTDIDGNFSP